MLIIEIQENIIKAQNALRYLESDPIYKGYKTLGGRGKFEQGLRTILTELIGLRNSYISHVQAVIKSSENKDLLTLIDSRYFERYANAVSTESLIRIASFTDFRIPETSLKVISENKQVVIELQAITYEIKLYNSIITDFRQRRNKYYITFYKIPDCNELPDVIAGNVNIENILPNPDVLSNFIRNISLVEPHKAKICIQPKKENEEIEIHKKESSLEFKKIKILKKK